jgi:hypothetical protein
MNWKAFGKAGRALRELHPGICVEGLGITTGTSESGLSGIHVWAVTATVTCLVVVWWSLSLHTCTRRHVPDGSVMSIAVRTSEHSVQFCPQNDLQTGVTAVQKRVTV